MIDKLRRIYVPFLLISITCILTYTFFNWLLFIKFELIPIDEAILGFWIPLFIPLIPVLIWLRPRLSLLEFKNATHRVDYQFIAVALIAVPNIIAQHYVATAAGALTSVDRVSEIDQFGKAKYYYITHYSGDRDAASMNVVVRPSGGRTPELVLSTFFVTPLTDFAGDAPHSGCKAWLGIFYSERISNRIFDSRTEQEEKLKAFVSNSVAAFKQANLSGFSYFERLGNNQGRVDFESAIHKNPNYIAISAPIILIGIRTPFELRNGHALVWALGTFGAGGIIWLFMLVIPKIGTTQWIRRQRRAAEKEKQITRTLARGTEITIAIAGVNVSVFLIMAFSGLGVGPFDSQALMAWGANHSPLVHQGQWFRLVTSIFVHGGLLHAINNSYGLLLAGLLLEPSLGKLKFALLYFAAGVVGSLFSVWFHPDTISVGASGAILGLYGALIAGAAFEKHREAAGVPMLNLIIYVGANLLIGSVSRGIDNAAHIGGFLTGILLGVIFFAMQKFQDKQDVSLR